MNKPLLYCVEDEESIRGLVAYVLTGHHYEVHAFEGSTSFWSALEKRRPDLILLDIMLDGEDGLTILRKLRSQPATAAIPVIMLTAKGTEYDIVKGLDDGADDYITKPFGVVELVSRVKALLRRTMGSALKASALLAADTLRVNTESREVTLDGTPLSLTLKEYDLLVYLMENRGIALSRDRIMEAVWGFTYEGESRTVDVHIKSLRQQLGPVGRYIKTIRGIGYRWELSL